MSVSQITLFLQFLVCECPLAHFTHTNTLLADKAVMPWVRLRLLSYWKCACLDSPLWRITELKADKTITIPYSLCLLALLSLPGCSIKEMSAGKWLLEKGKPCCIKSNTALLFHRRCGYSKAKQDPDEEKMHFHNGHSKSNWNRQTDTSGFKQSSVG